MKKGLLVWTISIAGAMSLLVVTAAGAQTRTSAPSSILSRFSVQTGIGFHAGDVEPPDGDSGFLLDFGGAYHFDQNWSAGVEFQLGFDDDFLLFSMPFFGRYDFAVLPIDVPILSQIHPFAKLGLGFTVADFDARGVHTDDTGFLFLMGGGLAYPINDNLSVETRMQFNITTNNLFKDDFYFSWDMISVRYRF